MIPRKCSLWVFLVCSNVISKQTHAVMCGLFNAYMPPHLYILFALMNVHWCIDRECNDTAYYTNNHGIDCTNYIQANYPDVLSSQLLVQLLENDRMLSERRDWVLTICASIKWYGWSIPWPLWMVATSYCTIHSLFLISCEMIAQLNIRAVYYMAIVVPMQWLAGNTHLLQH